MRHLAIGAGATLMLVVWAHAQQNSDKIQFDVASIHPADTNRITGGAVSSSKLDKHFVELRGFTLQALIKMAYQVQDYQLAGGPGWSASDGFDIDARSPADATVQQIPKMLQALLADRFQLVVHRETRTVPAFELVLGKNGPKLHEAATATEAGFGWGPRMIRSKGASMAGFAERLADTLQHPVVDHTGLKGIYAVELTFAPVDPDSPDPGPSIFSAIQDQLGLKLETTRAPVEVTVIDRAEKPSRN